MPSINVSLDTRKIFIKSFIWGVVQTWLGNLDFKDRNRVDAFEMWCWRSALSLLWTERVPKDKVLRRVGERKMLTGSNMESRINMVGHLLRHSNWFTALIERRSGKGRPRQEYTDRLKIRRMMWYDVVIKRQSIERKELQTH